MDKRWVGLCLLAGLAVFPVVMQSAISTLRTMASANTKLVMRDTPRAIGAVTFTDSKGTAMTLADFKGRHVLLNIWATWCPPCRKEMPSLDRLKPILERDSDFTVVALSVDTAGFAQLQAFYDTYGLKNLGLYRGEQGAVLDFLQIGGLPTTLLLDHQGLEVGRLIGPTQWDAPDVIANLKALHGKR